ncbi:ATP-binding protein [Dactylosporangium sp. NPDC048998]|uniref:ATP-binding protein n=1 Tax=Dactylosporangium sp. NPDC048998 TaxID=3363976 RepID=UPI003711DF53
MATSAWVRPAQLPADLATFAGREAELAVIGEPPAGPGAGPATVVITALGGMAGVGKTTLAVHWAHRVADRFPDGQLYLDLRGFGPADRPVEPADALPGLLRSLGVPGGDLPSGLDAQAALYRSRLAGRRMLILLDNARDSEQVRPLLPGTPGCLVLVTSRNELTGLVVVDGAHPVRVDLLDDAAARKLLARRLSKRFDEAAPAAVATIVGLCAGLPLALAVVAARLATSPGHTLDSVADDLRAAGGGLEALRGPDATTDPRAVFSWSYRALSPSAAALFRALGVHPGPDIGRAAAASLLGAPPGTARAALLELERASLVVEHRLGRFVVHDLLREYARERFADAPADERDAVHRRLFDHHLHTAHRAETLLTPTRVPVEFPAPAPGTTPEPLADEEQALTWFAAEYPVLVALLHRAADQRRDADVTRLAWALGTFQRRHGHWADQLATQGLVLAAAQRLGDPAAVADAQRDLGHALSRTGDSDAAREQMKLAIAGYAALGDHTGEAHAERGLGFALLSAGRHAEALRHIGRAGELYEALGNRGGLAKSLNETGYIETLRGDHRAGITRCEQALVLFRELGDRHGEAATLDSLGNAYHRAGDLDRALAAHAASVELFKQVGDRYEMAVGYDSLGDVHRDAGDPDAARSMWQAALALYRELEHPAADAVAAKL